MQKDLQKMNARARTNDTYFLESYCFADQGTCADQLWLRHACAHETFSLLGSATVKSVEDDRH